MHRSGPTIAILMILAIAGVAFAHHAAQGIVDEEIYAMIEDLVDGTPHGDFLITDLGGGMMEILITNVTVREVENMIEDGLLTYGGMLDGEVVAEISFATMRNVEVVIVQTE